jgi:hypothetical protein
VHDYTCISVMDYHEKRQVYLERFNQIGWQQQRNRLLTLYERFQPISIWAEENSIGSVNIEALRGEDLPVRAFTTTARSKGPLIDTLVLGIEQETVTLLSDVILIQELQAYETSRMANGGWRYSAPPGGHDDTVIATALSLWACDHTSRFRIDFV